MAGGFAAPKGIRLREKKTAGRGFGRSMSLRVQDDKGGEGLWTEEIEVS